MGRHKSDGAGTFEVAEALGVDSTTTPVSGLLRHAPLVTHRDDDGKIDRLLLRDKSATSLMVKCGYHAIDCYRR